MGVHAGEPVTEGEGFFQDAVQITTWLCDVAGVGEIAISGRIKDYAKTSVQPNEKPLKVLSPADEKFLHAYMTNIQPTLSDEAIPLEKLCKSLGISRAQLYRKITSMTGHSPNSFMQELRLRKALRLLMQQYGNIAEIAFASGYNNPSYFTRSFQKRFGMLPAQVLRSVE